jgi:SAM-dependent methyltransferase
VTDFDPRQYGARWAEQYDEWHAGLMDDEGALAALTELAADPGGPILEFAVGTGRLAVPLAERGHEVVGIDISENMLAKLRAKPGAARVETVLGDMTTVRLDRDFGLVLLAFSSLFALGTQRAQVQLFRNAAAHLRPGGRFVLETTVVDVPGGRGTQRHLRVAKLEPDRLVLSAGLLDPATSFYNGAWIVLEPTGTTFYPIQGRNVSHHEMDLMAELAGLELEHRWADWNRTPFTAEANLHISVYRKPTAA